MSEVKKLPDHQKIFEAHELWLTSGSKRGEFADLKGAQLHNLNAPKARLDQAMLEQTDLTNAKLAKASLVHSRLRGAKLENAILRGANLKGADLRQARLNGADLRDANLRNADLTEVDELLGSQLVGADLTDARLPKGLLESYNLGNVAEASKNASQLFFSMLVLCSYAWLTILTTRDVELFTSSGTASLPILNVKVSILFLYLTMPVLLIAFYIYLHFNLQRLWEGLACLPAIFPDGQRLDQRVYPWPLNGLVCDYIPVLRANRPVFTKLQKYLAIFFCLVFRALYHWGSQSRRQYPLGHRFF